MKTILVATDFSPAARNAANFAADLAVACKADLYLLHIYQMPLLFLEVPLPVTTDAMMEDTHKEILRLKNELENKTGGLVKIHAEIRMGTFFADLKTVCEHIDPYYVVMGSQGTTAAERLLFGSHTVAAMKQLRWPLVAVPLKAVFSSIKKIGLAWDFYQVTDAMPLDDIKTLAMSCNAGLEILNTGLEGEFKPEIVIESGILRKRLAPLEPNFRFITNADTAEAIIEFVDKNGIDLLIVFPRPHDLLDKLVHTSVSKELILHSHTPVLAIHI
jgi:nucleotide-binding universal stress UspA family protein